MDIRGIDYLGLDRVLRRGSGEILVAQDDALLIRDTVSGALLLACEDAAVGLPLLDRSVCRDCALLMVSNIALGKAAYERCGFSEMLECCQVAYYGERPSTDTGISVRIADEGDLPISCSAITGSARKSLNGSSCENRSCSATTGTAGSALSASTSKAAWDFCTSSLNTGTEGLEPRFKGASSQRRWTKATSRSARWKRGTSPR